MGSEVYMCILHGARGADATDDFGRGLLDDEVHHDGCGHGEAVPSFVRSGLG